MVVAVRVGIMTQSCKREFDVSRIRALGLGERAMGGQVRFGSSVSCWWRVLVQVLVCMCMCICGLRFELIALLGPFPVTRDKQRLADLSSIDVRLAIGVLAYGWCCVGVGVTRGGRDARGAGAGEFGAWGG